MRLNDRIPAYRLNMCGRLPGLAHLPDVWREPLGGVLPGAARRGLIVDCRSAEYATAWRLAGELAERTVVVKLRAASYDAKHLRGVLARRIVTDAVDPAEPAELADTLSDHFKLELVLPSDRAGPGLKLDEALTEVHLELQLVAPRIPWLPTVEMDGLSSRDRVTPSRTRRTRFIPHRW